MWTTWSARFENAFHRVMIDFDFTADWMTERFEIVKPITLRIYEKPIQIRITHNFGHSMKSALAVVTSYSILSHTGTYFYLPDVSYESRQIKARCFCPYILQWLFLFVEHSLERHTVPLKSKLSPQDTTNSSCEMRHSYHEKRHGLARAFLKVTDA